MDKLSELADRLSPYLARQLTDAQQTSATSGSTSNVIDDSTYLKQTNSPTLLGDLPVAAGVLIDGVDLSALADAYTSHLGSDVHQQYAGANGSGLTREAYQAARLSKSIIAGNGLIGGGLLDASRTLDIGGGNGINVVADGIEVDQSADFSWSGAHQFQQKIITHDMEPDLTDTRKIGTTDKRYLTADISEIRSTVFAEYSIHPIGGYFLITKDQGVLSGDVPAQSFQTVINFGRVMTLNDIVEFRDNGKVEYMKILVAQGVFGLYSCQRDLDGSGPNFWAAGSVYAVKGQAGDGYIALNAYDSPRMQVWKKGAAHNDDTEQVRIGDLNGNWGYGASTFGVAIGEYAANKPNITLDPVSGLRIRTYTTDVLAFDTLGNAEIKGSLSFNNKLARIGYDGIQLDIDTPTGGEYAFTVAGTGGTKEIVGGVDASDTASGRVFTAKMTTNGKSKHCSSYLLSEANVLGYEAMTMVRAKHGLREAYARFLATSSGKTIELVADSTTITGTLGVSSSLSASAGSFTGAVNAGSGTITGNWTVNGLITGTLAQTAWQTAILGNSWVNLSTATYEGVGYRKNALGKLELKGVLAGGTFANGTVLFTTNVGYRPSRRRILLGAGHNNVGVRIDIDTNGNVMVYGLTGNTFLSLDGIDVSL